VTQSDRRLRYMNARLFKLSITSLISPSMPLSTVLSVQIGVCGLRRPQISRKSVSRDSGSGNDGCVVRFTFIFQCGDQIPSQLSPQFQRKGHHPPRPFCFAELVTRLFPPFPISSSIDGKTSSFDKAQPGGSNWRAEFFKDTADFVTSSSDRKYLLTGSHDEK
jgi:hypothetical protein